MLAEVTRHASRAPGRKWWCYRVRVCVCLRVCSCLWMWVKQGQPMGVGVQSGFCFPRSSFAISSKKQWKFPHQFHQGKSQKRTSYVFSLKHLIHSSWFQCFVPEGYILLNSSAAARFMLYIETLSTKMTIVFSQCEQSAHSCFLFTSNLTNVIYLCFTLCFLFLPSYLVRGQCQPSIFFS